jgi:Zn-dependent protease
MELDLGKHPLEMILIYLFLVLSLGMHEAAHAKVAGLFGDTQPRQDGVDTWNPLPHIMRSFFSCVIVPAITWFLGRFFIGGAFVQINPANMKRPRLGYATAVASGPLMNLALSILAGLLAIVFSLITKKPESSAVFIMLIVGSFNFFIFVFNLLPLPPLDGAVIIRTVFPATERFFKRLQSLPLLIIFIVVLQFGAIGSIFMFPVNLYRDVFTDIINLLPLR